MMTTEKNTPVPVDSTPEIREIALRLSVKSYGGDGAAGSEIVKRAIRFEKYLTTGQELPHQ